MSAHQGILDFETGAREPGLVHIYIYTEISTGRVVYVGQSVDVGQRHSEHLSGGDIKFDEVLRSRPHAYKRKVIGKAPAGAAANARELELIDQYGTWIELGIGYNRRVLKTWRQRAEEHFEKSDVTVDFLGGDGPFAAVRTCRRLHKKGDHRGYFPHIVYRLFATREEAERTLWAACRPLAKRRTEIDVDCDVSNHSVVHFWWDRDGDRTWKHATAFIQVVNDDELIPF